jgi:hypothetical protein
LQIRRNYFATKIAAMESHWTLSIRRFKVFGLLCSEAMVPNRRSRPFQALKTDEILNVSVFARPESVTASRSLDHCEWNCLAAAMFWYSDVSASANAQRIANLPHIATLMPSIRAKIL